MALYPKARIRLLPEAGQQPTITPTQVIHHVAVSEAQSLYGFWTSPGENLESHFYIAYDGQVEQYVDTSRSADANYTANRRPDGTGAVSIETAGLGPGSWTDDQLRSIVELDRWLHATHAIPLRVCRTSSDPGYGWHVMFGAPGPWTPAVGKICPGPNRVQQFQTIIMPRLLGQEEEDMPLTPTDAQTVWNDPADWPKAVTDLPHSARYSMSDWVVGANIAASRAARDAKAALAGLASLTAQVAALTALLGQGGGLDAAQARQIATEAAKEAVDGITVTVHEGTG